VDDDREHLTEFPRPRGVVWGDVSAAALLVVVVGVFFWRVTLAGEILLPLDVMQSTEPWKSELPRETQAPIWNPVVTDGLWSYYPMAVRSSAAWDRGLPLWDPAVLVGMPAWAQGKLFSNPLFVVLSRALHPARAQSFTGILSITFGALFMFLLLRTMEIGRLGAVVSALTFALNTHVIGWLTDPTFVASMCLFPAVFLGVELAIRRHHPAMALVGSVAFALQILSGTILYPFYCAIALVLFCCYRSLAELLAKNSPAETTRPLFAGFITLGVGTLLAAPQLIPTIELFLHTPRSQPIGATSFLPIRYIPKILAPDLFGSPLHGQTYWGLFNSTETGLYFGVLGLLLIPLALWCRQRVLAAGLFFLGATTYLAVFNIFPFRHFVEIAFPIFLHTFPGRVFIVTAFAWAIVAGMGADAIVGACPKRIVHRTSVVTSICGILIVVFGVALRHWFPEFATAQRIVPIVWAAGWTFAAAGALWACSRPFLRPRLASVAVVGVIVVDLWWAGGGYNPAFPIGDLYPRTPSLDALTGLVEQERRPVRVLNVNSGTIMVGNTLSVFGIDTVAGYSSWILHRHYEYAKLTGHFSGATNFLYFNGCCNPLLDALNIRYVITDPSTQLFDSGGLRIFDKFANTKIVQSWGADVHPDHWQIDGLERRVIFAHPPSRISVQLQLSSGARFETSLMMDPSCWNQPGDGVRFRVTLEQSRDEPPIALVDRYIDPKNTPGDRRPVRVAVDLGPWQGLNIVLDLETDSGPSGDSRFDWAGWVDPIVTTNRGPDENLVFDGPNRIYRNPDALPRAWLVHTVHTVGEGDIESAKRIMGSADFDPASQAVVEGDLGIEPLPPRGPEEVNILAYESERVVIRTRSSAPGLLVLADSVYPGWSATVGSEPRPIMTTNLIMRGVALEPGDHIVEFVFAPMSFRLGLVASIVTGALALIVVSVNSKRKWRC
jgi:hypothetical protein